MSVVLTVKVEGLIEPPLAQMASTKACYKLGLSLIFILEWSQKWYDNLYKYVYFSDQRPKVIFGN